MNYFTREYKDANIEHGFEIDQNGYVWQNLVGTSNSVSLGATHEQAGITIHNHPMDSGQKDYSHFSGTDLRTFARNKKEKTMYVVSKKATYRIKKGTQFDSDGFVDAMKKAKAKTNSSYDASVDDFLTQNQKKYHYVYSKTK